MVSTLICVAALLSADSEPPAKPAAKAAARPSDPALLAEYNGQRAKAGNSADAHWKLGLWCEQKGLKPEAQAEFYTVTQLDPKRDGAWKKLGLVKHNGQWKTPAQIAAERAEAAAQRQADAHWRPLLQKWKTGLGQKDRRADSEEALAGVKDPRAVPSVWKVFGAGSPADQERAIDIFGHIEGDRSTRALAAMAIYGKTEVVRQAAIATLTRRNPDDVVMNWILLLREPIKYEVRPVAGPGSAGMLIVEGEQFNVRRFYAPPSIDQVANLFVNNPSLPSESLTLESGGGEQLHPPIGSRPIGYTPDGLRLYIYDHPKSPLAPSPPPTGGLSPGYQAAQGGLLQAAADFDYEVTEASKMAAGAQAQLEHDVNVVESANTATRELNARAVEALRRISGKDLGASQEEWLKWWMTKRGYAYTPPKERSKATVDVTVPLPYVPQTGPPSIRMSGGGGNSGSGFCVIVIAKDFCANPRCFVAGTIVQTQAGPRTIDSVRVGDRVLTADSSNSSPQEGVVRLVHRSTAARTLRLVLGGEAIVTTEGHPFWKVGSGWIRAGDLSVDDEVMSRNGPVRVEARDLRASAAVWNLLVDDGASFYVGRVGALVHDGSPVMGAAARADVESWASSHERSTGSSR